MIEIPIEISSRHIHLSQRHVEKLFGAGYKLKPLRKLSQKGEFASTEVLTLKNGAREIAGVRVLGPARPQTQVEISQTDAYKLDIQPPLRLSGDIKGSAGLTLVGPKGKVALREGVIVAIRHIHANPAQARLYGLKNGQKVSVRVPSGGERASGRAGEQAVARGLTFDNVIVRVAPNYNWRLQLDTDEGNAAGAKNGTRAEVVKPSWWRM